MVQDYPDYTLPVVHVGAITVEGSVSVLGTVEVKGAVTVSGTVSISGIVTVTGSVTVSGTVSISGTVTVTGSVTVSGTVSITGTVTVTGAVTVSGTVHVDTIAADNIIIDKLTVGAYVSRRSTLSNNGETASWASCTGDNRKGKFFPRGCRGFLGIIEVYCRQTVAGDETITVYLSPHPSMGPVASATIDVPAFSSPDWRSAAFNRMWNYDSLFIFIVTSNANVGIGYDAASPDHFFSTDAGATWTADPTNRYWFRAVMEGETVGDLPVAGTLNVIEIPNVAAARSARYLSVGPSSELFDTEQVGSGQTLIVIFEVLGDLDKDNLHPRIKCDGVEVLPNDTSMNWWNEKFASVTSPGITIVKWNVTNHYYIISVTINYPFKHSLKVGFYNEHAENTYVGYVSYSYEKIG